MRVGRRLLWKLLFINVVPVIVVIILVVWIAIDQLAADYFMALMMKYEVEPTEIHSMFLSSIHRFLLWSSVAGLILAFLLSYFLTRRVLRPLSQMTRVTKDVAAGNFTARVEVTTGDEVGELGVSFNRMADSLERVERLRKNMVADVAHELRTPLTNLRGYLEGLADRVLEPTPQVLQMLRDEVLHLVRLVDNIQQLVRADAAKGMLNRQSFPLAQELQGLLRLYRPVFDARSIAVTASLDEEVMVNADRDKLLQATRNLLENAAKYTPENGRVSVACEQEGGVARVTVTNSGPGIHATDLPFIFERFFRTDRSRSREAGGAGIGLAITKELIEAHGGQVGAESRPGRTSIWFTLP